MTKTRPCIHVIDDDPDVRDSLLILLKAQGFDVRTYSAPASFLASDGADRGGCVLTDLRMPEMNGIDLLRKMKQLNIPLPVVVMTAYGDIAQAVLAMKLGAAEFIEKPFDGHKLLACLRSALAIHRDPRLLNGGSRAASERFTKLTARENDVLAGIIDGKPNKVIAFDLGISVRTVEGHRTSIMTKIAVDSLSELIRIVLLAGPKLLTSADTAEAPSPDARPGR
jgi:two-component system response regulator FixJ